MMQSEWRRDWQSERARAGGRRMLRAIFVVGLVTGGCNTQHVLGTVDGTGGSGGDAGPTFPGVPIDAGYPGDVSGLGARQSWTGYVEAYQFRSGSDAVHLSFATDSNGVVVGTVTLGAGTPPPPATDPNAFYPPEGSLQNPANVLLLPIEGFPYTIAQGSLVGGRLRFMIWEAEIFNSWCALQTPVPGTTRCLPDWSSTGNWQTNQCTQMSPSGQVVSVSCAKLQLCQIEMVCNCSADGCTEQLNDPLSFDMVITGTTADGGMSQYGASEHNIRLTQDP